MLDTLINNGNNSKNESFKLKGVINMETMGNINKRNNFQNNINHEIIKISTGDDDLLDMDFEQIILFDKRIYLT